MVEFVCHCDGPSNPLHHVWERCIGSGHAALALRADWQRQLLRCRRELGVERVRFHGILSDDVGIVGTRGTAGPLAFFNVDQIFDFLLSIGVRPFVELSFMPASLASGTRTVFHYQGNVTPPAKWRDWERLIRALVRHWTERYGAGEVSRWHFEVWNEPNLSAFASGRQRDYFAMYRRTAQAIKDIDASYQVGGPATAQNAWLDDFVEYCERHRVPLDFVSTHLYPTDAFGTTSTDTVTQLAESPPDMMRDRARESRRIAGDRPLYYTEWNVTSNPRDTLHDQPFTAAFGTDIALSVDAFVDGYSYWTFTDIFFENDFPTRPFHGGFGLLNLYGIPKPAYRAFELLHRLGHTSPRVAGTHRTVRVRAVRDDRTVALVITNHALPRHRIAAESVRITLAGAVSAHRAFVERIDETHANAPARWVELGRPDVLDRRGVDLLEEASRVVREPQAIARDGGLPHVTVTVPPHGVAVVTVEMGDRPL